ERGAANASEYEKLAGGARAWRAGGLVEVDRVAALEAERDDVLVYVVCPCISGVSAPPCCALPQVGVSADDRDITKKLVSRTQVQRQRIDVGIRTRRTLGPRHRVAGTEVDNETARQRLNRD